MAPGREKNVHQHGQENAEHYIENDRFAFGSFADYQGLPLSAQPTYHPFVCSLESLTWESPLWNCLSPLQSRPLIRLARLGDSAASPLEWR